MSKPLIATALPIETALAAPECSAPEMRAKILELERAMLSMPERLIHIEPKHYFAEGLYLREITIPKDVTLTGAIHKTEHYCILAQGEVSVRTESGIRRIKAPSVIHSLPGMKRVLYAHEDSLWINVHHNPTNERDLEKIEGIFTAPTFDEIPGGLKTPLIEGGK